MYFILHEVCPLEMYSLLLTPCNITCFIDNNTLVALSVYCVLMCYTLDNLCGYMCTYLYIHEVCRGCPQYL